MSEESALRILAIVLGAAIGGAVGWWLGAFRGTMTAFISMVGTGLGIHVVRRWHDMYLGS